jgi:hypothetical protein
MGVLENRDELDQGGEEVRPPFSIVDPADDSDNPAIDPIEESNGVEIPLVMPGRRGSSFWRRHGRGIIMVAAIMLVLSAVWVLYDRFGAGETGSAAAFSSIADRARMPELLDIAEGFETAVSRYRERMEDFDLGRLGCEGLWTGYRAVDERFISLSEQYATGRGEAADRLYEDSKRSLEEIERHYDASGCPRRD